MKHGILLLKILCLGLLLQGGADIFAQKNPCDQLMKQGDAFADAGNFPRAIDKYTAALIVCPDLQDDARDSIQSVFSRIEQLRRESKDNEVKAIKALAKAEASEKLAREASEKQQQLIDAFYFYEDSLALAFDGCQFGFVDKEGEVKIEYQYFTADAFTDPGIARADYGEGLGLLDTRGQFYALQEYDDSDSLVEDAQAVILKKMSRKVLFEKCAPLFEVQILLLTGTFHPDFPEYVPPDARTEKEPYGWDAIFGLENLVILDLSGNQMDSISLAVGNLKALKRLSLAYNYIARLPVEIGNLDSLEWLNLTRSGLVNPDTSAFPNAASAMNHPLPPEIGRLKQLKNLNLSENTLYSLPPEITTLSNLRTLNVQSSLLARLPEEIGRLDSLKKLNISENRFESLPSQIGELKNLTELVCYRNQLKTLPKEIGELKHLRELNLFENHIDSLPEEIWNLQRLESLLLCQNSIEKLPASVEKLRSLKTLDLGMNRIKALPESIGKLTSLQALYISGNQLETLPESFCDLSSLIYLDLDKNPLTALPQGIGKLKNLRYLSIRGCSFEDLDEVFRIIEQLPNCEVIIAEYED